MEIHERLRAAIERAGVPAYLIEAKPTAQLPVVPDRYATYVRISTTNPLGCDNRDRMRRHALRVDVFDISDPTDAVAAVRASLEEAGFGIRSWRDLSEYEGAGYRVSMSVQYNEDLDFTD